MLLLLVTSLVLLASGPATAQIPEGCVDCGLPDHPHCGRLI